MLQNKEIEFLNKKQLKQNRWIHAEEVIHYFCTLGFDVFVFEASKQTPHIRIDGHVDYWPASKRFYDMQQKIKGIGWENLKKHFQKKMQNKQQS